MVSAHNQQSTDKHARDEHARQAAVERLWSHTVGIANRAEPAVGTDPISGIMAREAEAPGTGVAGAWGKCRFVLTAKHVLEKADIADLNFFARPTGALVKKSEITIEDALVAVPLKGAAEIHRCNWEDLALVTLTEDALGSYLEFADIATSWVDPKEGQTVIGMGFPVSAGLVFQRQVGSNFQRAILSEPHKLQWGCAARGCGQVPPRLRFQSSLPNPFRSRKARQAPERNKRSCRLASDARETSHLVGSIPLCRRLYVMLQRRHNREDREALQDTRIPNRGARPASRGLISSPTRAPSCLKALPSRSRPGA